MQFNTAISTMQRIMMNNFIDGFMAGINKTNGLMCDATNREEAEKDPADYSGIKFEIECNGKKYKASMSHSGFSMNVKTHDGWSVGSFRNTDTVIKAIIKHAR